MNFHFISIIIRRLHFILRLLTCIFSAYVLFYTQVRVILAALIVKIRNSDCQLKLRDLSMAIIGKNSYLILHWNCLCSRARLPHSAPCPAMPLYFCYPLRFCSDPAIPYHVLHCTALYFTSLSCYA